MELVIAPPMGSVCASLPHVHTCNYDIGMCSHIYIYISVYIHSYTYIYKSQYVSLYDISIYHDSRVLSCMPEVDSVCAVLLFGVRHTRVGKRRIAACVHTEIVHKYAGSDISICTRGLAPLMLGMAMLCISETTPVGFEPTRGDPIGLAGRRLSHSAKVSLDS